MFVRTSILPRFAHNYLRPYQFHAAFLPRSLTLSLSAGEGTLLDKSSLLCIRGKPAVVVLSPVAASRALVAFNRYG